MFTWAFNDKEDDREDEPRAPKPPAVPLLNGVVVIDSEDDDDKAPSLSAAVAITAPLPQSTALPPSTPPRPLLPRLQNGAQFQGKVWKVCKV